MTTDQLPQAVNFEDVVLGAILLEKNALINVSHILHPDHFYSDQNKIIYESILSLDDQNKPIDLLTVRKELEQRNSLQYIGGSTKLASLTNRVCSSAHIEQHASTIVEKWSLRELIKLGVTVQEESKKQDSDPDSISYQIYTGIEAIEDKRSKNTFSLVGDDIPGALNELQERQNEQGLLGVPSGNTELDRLLHGWVGGRFIVCAGRTAMGKTTKMLNWAYKAAYDFNYPVAIFSLEMSRYELIYKLISMHSGISHERIMRGELEPDEWKVINREIGKLEKLPIVVDDEASQTAYQIRSKMRRFKKNFGCKACFVDYIQIIKGDDRKDFRINVTENCNRLKAISRELDVPVLALAQLSREVEKRNEKKPILSDLKESGGIEEASDQVIFIYRPEYYGVTEDFEGKPTEGKTELIVAKNRHGYCDTISEYADLSTSTYSEQAPF